MLGAGLRVQGAALLATALLAGCWSPIRMYDGDARRSEEVALLGVQIWQPASFGYIAVESVSVDGKKVLLFDPLGELRSDGVSDQETWGTCPSPYSCMELLPGPHELTGGLRERDTLDNNRDDALVFLEGLAAVAVIGGGLATGQGGVPNLSSGTQGNRHGPRRKWILVKATHRTLSFTAEAGHEYGVRWLFESDLEGYHVRKFGVFDESAPGRPNVGNPAEPGE